MLPSAFARRKFASVVLQNMLIAGSIAAGAWLRLRQDWWAWCTTDGRLFKLWLVAAVVQFCLYCSELYDSGPYGEASEFVRIAKGLGTAIVTLGVFFFWIPDLTIGRGVFLAASGLIIVVLGASRLIGHRLGHTTRERLLLVGTGPQSVALARELFERRNDFGVEIVGFIDPDPARIGAPVINPGVIGSIDDIRRIVAERDVSRVVVSLEDARGRLPMDKLLSLKLSGVRFDHLASVYEDYTGKIAVENLRPSWFVFSDGFARKDRVRAIKRGVDVIASAVGLVFGAPVMLLVAIGVKLTSAGPVLYQQTRVGQHGRTFTLYKFRSMCVDAEASSGAVWAYRGDPRVTPFGRFLRRVRLDELPQLWNVLRGDMSLIGPRPERPEFVERLTAEIPFYGERHVVKPGLTGWAQVRYSYGATIEDALQKLQYDLFYVKNFTLGLDVLILVNTVKTVLLGRGA